MFSVRIAKHLLYLVLIVSIHHISVSKCQSTPKRIQALGINKNLNKDKQKDIKNVPKVEKEIESETQMAIEDIGNTTFDLTTLAIDYREDINQTNNVTLSAIDNNWTLTESSLIINGTDVTTPLFNLNITTNDSLVSMIDETPDYMNNTESSVILTNFTTHLSPNYSTTPILYDNITNVTTDLTEIPSETPTEVTDALNRSPIYSSTITPIESLTESTIEFDMNLNEENPKCVFVNQIHCKNFELKCFGSGEIDCGSRTKRSADNQTFDDNLEFETQIFKSYLERQSQSENIENIRCILTAAENKYFSCNPLPTITECKGKTVCKPTDESTDLNESIPFWKVGLIAALTAIGGIAFIIVAIIAYVSYNKLKVRPESSANGYHNNPQNVTRV